ncbi:hypothetical protein CKAH01_17491 [Colletotrichum kahawae]|uniref:Uncharacterized protein n=1 Tax=Colletotrichum kahawae TaxID=34407 RepID=A0AAE0D4Q1_COLKA|nr:hypothetical protein CKAH01_17491 [Colletotrichum kahawae]
MNPKTFLAIMFAFTALAVPNQNKNNLEPREALPQRGGGGVPSANCCGINPRPSGCQC